MRRTTVPELRLSKREAKRLSRELQARQKSEDRKPAYWKRVLDRMREQRATALLRPGRRGWAGRGTGRVGYIESPVEYQGTSVQVCGLWPFIAGSGSAVVGVPLGRHLTRGSIVCADPIQWFLNNLILNPSAFILGRPGLGKSSISRRMATVLQAWGYVPMVLSDTKPDYVELIKAMDGQVIRLGRGLGTLNPLDLGSLVASLSTITDDQKRREALEEMRGRRQTIVEGLLGLVLDRKLEAHETSIVSECLRSLDPELTEHMLLDDVRRYIAGRPAPLRALALATDDDAHYDRRVAGLLDGLTALGANGPFGDMFAAPTSEHINLGQPVVFDMSAIDDADMRMQAAVQSVCWNYGSATVSAEKHLAEAGQREQRHYLLIMDELWRMLRASEQMVFFLDALTRLNRQRGLGQIMITHTMNDLELASEHLTKIAWGFVERSAMVFLGGLAQREMGNLEEVFALSHAERSLITDWSTESKVNPETNTADAPPGRGKFLLKVGKKPGIPFQAIMTSSERDVNDTNKAWNRKAAA